MSEGASRGPGSPVRAGLRARVDAVEESYEFFLAYAAQGVSGKGGAGSGAQIHDFLGRMKRALDGLAEAFTEVVEGEETSPSEAWVQLIEVLRRDASAALAAVRVVAARDAVSSQLVDNLNANIHLRAVLTDLFLMDEALDRPDGP